MARTVITTITDDLDGSADASTVTFSLDGTSYEIDLSDRNTEKLNALLKPYIEAGRKIGASRASSGSKAPRKRKELGPVRTWAAEQGYNLNDRGRIPKEVLDAYDAAH